MTSDARRRLPGGFPVTSGGASISTAASLAALKMERHEFRLGRERVEIAGPGNDRRLLPEHVLEPEIRIDAVADEAGIDDRQIGQRPLAAAPLGEIVLLDTVLQPLDQRRALVGEVVERLAGQFGRLPDRRIGGVRRQRALVEAARALLIAAQEIARGDADLGAGKLLLAEELVAAGERRVAQLQRSRLAQRGAEMPLAEQVLDARQRDLRAGILRDAVQRRRIGVHQRVAHAGRQLDRAEHRRCECRGCA
jgi:hypothetical protein